MVAVGGTKAPARVVASGDQPQFLVAENLSLSYRTRGGQIEALNALSLSVGKGEFVSVLGPSGCGKSTLLKLAVGLIKPTQGWISIHGERVVGPRPDIGVAFQKPTLLPWKTVLDNVLMPSRGARQTEAARTRAIALLKMVGLENFATNYPRELSGGMQQRVGLARMLMNDPDILLMDEPFAALDAISRELLMEELQRIWLADRKSVLFITHSIPEAVFLSDRVAVMSGRPGKIIADLPINLPRPRTPEIMTLDLFGHLCHELRLHVRGAQGALT